MTRQGLLFTLVGLVLVGALIGGFLYYTRGNHLDLTGKITNVRTLPLDEKSALILVDFRVENPSDVEFVVRSVMPQVTAADGSQPEALHVADSDLQRIFAYYQKELGPRLHPSLLIKQKIAPHQAVEKMVSARFDVPQETLNSRRSVALRLEDVDGTVVLIQ